MGGGALCGSATRFADDGCIRITQQSLHKVGLLEDLATVVDRTAAKVTIKTSQVQQVSGQM